MSRNRPRLSDALRKAVRTRWQSGCSLCGRSSKVMHIDHIRPLSQGGTDTPSNLRLVCRACHNRLTRRLNGTGKREIGRDGLPL